MSTRKREFEYTQADFDVLRKMSNDHTGIIVPDDKFDMFYSRLSKHIRRLGLTNFADYCEVLSGDNASEFSEFINSITTNLTSFFREMHHFDYLRGTVIPQLLKANADTRKIRIWSAGCSTGEEPYSIAMTLLDNLPRGWEVKILATDLDTDVLSTAASGIYSADRIKGLLANLVRNWFMKSKPGQNDLVKVKSELQSIIRFRQLNLMGDWPMRGPFDVIFCRNVLIYFDKSTKIRLAQRFSEILANDSHLFIGHSESLYQLTSEFKLIGNTIYQKEKQSFDEKFQHQFA